MKKKIILMLAIVAILVCAFALSVSAENALKPQASNAYGELSFFDESISVGRTNNKYGFTPYIDAEGTVYARVVVGDGTTFYTFPTAYVLSESTIYGGEQYNIFVPDIASLNSAMEAATGVNPGWTIGDNVYRIEMPYSVTRVNGGGQNFSRFGQVIEIYLQPNSQVKDQNKSMIFYLCNNLETIHNLDTFVFRKGCLGGSFQECAKLTNITIGVSSEATETGDNMFNGCTALKSVNFAEAFPNLTKIGKNAFYNCTNLESISANGPAKTFVMQQTVTEIGNNAFYQCKSMEYISMSSSLTSIGQGAFQSCTGLKNLSIPTSVTTIGQIAFDGCTGLVFVDFNDNANVFNVDKYGQFKGCTSLLAVSLPDNYQYIPNQMFKGCTALKAVYLPGNLTTMDTNGWGDDPFNGCTNLYFVQDPFEVVDENGNFYTASTFVQPQRPDVYYMPKTLSALCTNKTSGKCFTGSYHLNPIIVFGENVTSTTLGDGIFYECGSQGTLGSGVTAVFLGDMTQLRVHPRESRSKGVKYIFANSADKSLADVNIICNTTNNYQLNDGTEGFYFCHGNCYYLLNGVKYSGTYTDSQLTKIEGAIHLVEPKRTEPIQATCTTNRAEIRYCFCTNSEVVEFENTALGHTHSVFADLVYADYSKEGYYSYQCERCDDVNNETKAPALFENFGYSAPETDFAGIAIGYMVNHSAIDEYSSLTGKTVVYGVFAVLESNIEDNDIFDVDGNKMAGVVCAEITRDNVAAFELKIVGFKTDEQKSASLAMGAYVSVTDGEGTKYSYLQDEQPAEGEKYYFTTYNKFVGIE